VDLPAAPAAAALSAGSESGARPGTGAPPAPGDGPRRARIRYLVACGALLALTLTAVHEQWLWRIDQALYDAHLPLWFRTPSQDIVIVAVDEESLSALGRWPWSRRTHAAMLTQLARARPRAIALDLILAEPDRDDPGADAALAEAMARGPPTVLPVVFDESRQGGALVETLPLAELARAAAGLGHVDVELDRDALARRVFLEAGLGAPHWPVLALALLRAADATAPADPLGRRAPRLAHPARSSAWQRDREFLVPFAGPPGRFRRVSAAHVVEGRFDDATFRNALVLIGATVAGLGDTLPSAVSGHHQPMPGVEFHANVVDALRAGIELRELPEAWQAAITAAVLLLAVYLYPRLTPLRGLVCVALLALTSLGVTMALMALGGVWFRPSALVLALVLSYPLWSWIRLEYALAYLDQEIRRLDEERRAIAVPAPADLAPAMRFVGELLPLQGWAPREDAAQPDAADSTRLLALHADGPRGVELRLRDGRVLEPDTERYLREALAPLTGPPPVESPAVAELVQARIAQIQSATEGLRLLRDLVRNSVAQMGNGVLVADPVGRVIFANRRAGTLLRGDDGAVAVGAALLGVLEDVAIEDGPGWLEALRLVLVERSGVQLSVRGHQGEDLLAHLGPLVDDAGTLQGLVLAIADVSTLRQSERARAEILAFVSHDLRAPLISVLSLVELAHEGRSRGELEASLHRAGEYAERTLALAEQFLELTRASDPDAVNRTVVDLEELAAQALHDVWDQAEARGIAIHNRLELEQAWVEVDASLVQRAIVNLLGNAIAYSPEQASVTLSLARDGASYVCCVADEGPGIAPEDLPHLFDRYRRGQAVRPSDGGGAGLGLAIVKEVAERHGGSVSVTSKPGAGSRFCITLPACPAPDLHGPA
jgi:signal transduction histidine kinase/CHASE2 domain-containing sensor protein